jgi:guanylate kinase
VRKLIPDTVGIFILPPSLDALTERLTSRAKDTPEVIERRLAAARTEIGHVHEFDYIVVNDDFGTAVKDLVSIVRSQRLRAPAQVERHGDLISKMK